MTGGRMLYWNESTEIFCCTVCTGFMLQSRGEMEQYYLKVEELKLPVHSVIFDGSLVPSCGQMKKWYKNLE